MLPEAIVAYTSGGFAIVGFQQSAESFSIEDRAVIASTGVIA